MIHEIYYATSRTRKFEEVKEYTLSYEQTMHIVRANLDIDEIQTLDQKAVALDKAKKAWAIIKKPLLIDDEGVFFDAYPLFPGTFSKYIPHALGEDGIAKLLSENNKASFRLTMVYLENEESIQIFEGSTQGIIAKKSDFPAPHPALTGMFQPNGTHKTYAELLGIKEIELFSPRIEAFKKFVTWYKHERNK